MKTKHIVIGASIISVGMAVALAIKNATAQANEPKIFYCKTLTGNYNAKTIPPFGIYILESQKDNQLLLQHELIHWKQYQQLGLLRYYIQYQKELKQFGYDKMPLQLEARIYESQWVQQNYTEAVRTGQAQTVYNPDFRK